MSIALVATGLEALPMLLIGSTVVLILKQIVNLGTASGDSRRTHERGSNHLAASTRVPVLGYPGT